MLYVALCRTYCCITCVMCIITHAETITAGVQPLVLRTLQGEAYLGREALTGGTKTSSKLTLCCSIERRDGGWRCFKMASACCLEVMCQIGSALHLIHSLSEGHKPAGFTSTFSLCPLLFSECVLSVQSVVKAKIRTIDAVNRPAEWAAAPPKMRLEHMPDLQEGPNN